MNLMKVLKILFWTVIIFVIVLALVLSFGSQKAKASPGGISPGANDHWAWNNIIGWIDFYNNDVVNFASQKLSGYASSSVGDISLDCATTRNGNTCGGPNNINYGVCSGNNASHLADGTCINTDSTGYLSGFAWNNKIGWISFNCNDSGGNCTNSPNHKVRIVAGDFTGFAWNNVIGWISFNCNNSGGNCLRSDHRVRLTYYPVQADSGTLESSIFDTQVSSTLNNIIWKGYQPYDSCVRFQIAVSNSTSGPWIYYGPGPFSTSHFNDSCSTVPDSNQTTVLKIPAADRNWIANNRYLRYKIFLKSSAAPNPSSTPIIDDIILNWSR